MNLTYKGSASELMKCNALAIIEVIDDYKLDIDEIDYYNSNFPSFSKYRITERTADGLFTFRFNVGDTFEISNVILYNSIGTPIGIYQLESICDVSKYRIEELSFKLEIKNSIEEYKSSQEIDIKDHIVLTTNFKSHKNLISKSDKGSFLSSDELLESYNSKKIFTKNLLNTIQNQKLHFRYSGGITKSKESIEDSLERYKMNSYTVGFSLALSTNLDVIKLERDYGEEQYLCGINYGRFHSKGLIFDTGEYSLSITGYDIIDFGSNYIVLTKIGGNEYYLVDTKKYLQDRGETPEFINKGFKFLSDEPDPLTFPIESTIFVKDPFSNELVIFQKRDNSHYYSTDDRLAIRQLMNLDKSDHTGKTVFSNELLYLSNGLAITTSDTPDGSYKVNYFFTNLPGTPSEMSYTDIEDDEWIPSFITEVSKNGLNRTNITPITPSLIFIKSGDKEYLMEVESDYNSEPNILKLCHKIKIHQLRIDGSFYNMDKLVKNLTSDLIGIELLNLSSDGCLWYRRENPDGSYTIGKL